MLLNLRFPKHVVLHNTRMRAIYNATVLGVLIVLVTMFVVQKLWSSTSSPKNFVKFVTWIEPHTLTQEMIDLWPKKLAAPMCQKENYFYDYQFDPDGIWTFSNFSCPKICTKQQATDCFIGEELVQNTQDGIFFTTSIRHSVLMAENSTQSAIGKYFHHFFPYEDVYKFRFQFHFNIAADDLASPTDMKLVSGISGRSNVDVLLVVLDHKDTMWKTYRPTPFGIEMTIPELLSLSGHSDLLDIAQPDLGMNYIPNTQNPTGPVARLTGTQIQCRLQCYESQTIPAKLKVKNWNSNVCSLRVIQSGSTWSKRHVLHTKSDSVTSRLYYGIHIAFDSEAELRHVDIPRAMDFLTTIIVLVALPSQFFRFFSVHCLGHLSRIYHRAVDETFSISHNVASLAMNMMIASSTYKYIADSEEGISLMQMEKLMRFCLSEYGELDTDEIHALCLFCFLVTHDLHDKKKKVGLVRGLTKSLMTSLDGIRAGQNSDVGEDENIHKGAFMSIMFESSRLALDDVTKLFDHDRRTSVLERVFLPPFVKGEIQQEQTLEGKDRDRARSDPEEAEAPEEAEGPAEAQQEVPEEATAADCVDWQNLTVVLASLQNRLDELEKCCKVLDQKLPNQTDVELPDRLLEFEGHLGKLGEAYDTLAEKYNDVERAHTTSIALLSETVSNAVKNELDTLHRGGVSALAISSKSNGRVDMRCPSEGVLANTSFSSLDASFRIRLDEQEAKLQSCMRILQHITDGSPQLKIERSEDNTVPNELGSFNASCWQAPGQDELQAWKSLDTCALPCISHRRRPRNFETFMGQQGPWNVLQCTGQRNKDTSSR